MIVAGKISVPLDKARWRPSILPQLITMVSTCDADGRPNFAPKSWIKRARVELNSPRTKMRHETIGVGFQ